MAEEWASNRRSGSFDALTFSGALSREAERIAAETMGWRLFTVLRYVEKDQAVERLYSSDEKAYPVAGLGVRASSLDWG